MLPSFPISTRRLAAAFVEGEALKERATRSTSVGCFASGAALKRFNTPEQIWRADIYHDASGKLHDAMKRIGRGQIKISGESTTSSNRRFRPSWHPAFAVRFRAGWAGCLLSPMDEYWNHRGRGL